MNFSRFRKKLLWLLIFCLTCIFSSGNETTYQIKQIDSYNELTQAWITSIIQDYIGFMWFGTHDGVYRYDGFELKLYQSMSGDYFTLPGNNVREIFEDSKNNLWVTTSRGISIYDRNKDCFVYSPDWPTNSFTDIVEDNEGNLYFGSFSGFFHYLPDSGAFRNYIQYPDSSDINNGHQEVFVTMDDRIILNSPYGISEFDKYSKKFYEVFDEALPYDPDAITCIVQDCNGTYWVGTRDYGLIYYDRLESKAFRRLNVHMDNVLIKGTILSLLQSADSTLWIGTENNGLILLNLKEFYNGKQVFHPIKNDELKTELSHNSIFSLYEDKQKNIWIGTYNGLNLYSSFLTNFNQIPIVFKQKPDVHDNIINTFLEDDNDIWIGTENGINIYNKENHNIAYYNYDPDKRNSLSSNSVWAIEKDRNGNFWIGTWGGGLNKYNTAKQQFTHFQHTEEDQNAISNNNIFCILEDEDGILWIATMGGGLNSYNPTNNSFKVYVHDNLDPLSISGDWVRQLHIDNKNRFWVLTYNAVSLFDREREKFTNFYSDESNPNSISDDGAIVIFEDSKSNIWLGTESGLNLFHPVDSGFTQYQIGQGLPSNVIHAILEDDDGNIWISTNNGISKFVHGTEVPENPEFVNFDVSDGLQGNKFNRRSALKTSDGFLIFGGNNGLNSFDPRSIKINTTIPDVIITNFLVFNKIQVSPQSDEIYIDKHISLMDQIKLKYKHSVFTIYYSSLDYLIPEKTQYAYMLEGFEESWNYVDNNRSATYTNLDPGKYIFRLKASNSSGLWNENPKNLEIIILPPWYRTFWAYLLYFALISISILFLRRLIVARTTLQHQLILKDVEKEKLDQLNKMKTKFYTNISHEFRTPLSLIISPLEALLSDINIQPAIKQQINVIQIHARRLLRLINQLLDISKIESDHLDLRVSRGDIVGFIKEIVTLFRWPALKRNIKFNFTSNQETYYGFFDGDKIEKICYNLISNALKYTQNGGQIDVEIAIGNGENQIDNGYVKLVFKDSGVGISEQDQGKIFEQFYRSGSGKNMDTGGFGIGLAIVNGLINAYHGSIQISSNNGEGTQFVILLPHARELFKTSEIDDADKGEKTITLDIYDLEPDSELPSAREAANGILHIDKQDKNSKILLVEDDKDLRSHLKNLFPEYIIFEAENGEQALCNLNETHPDLIISDVLMPEMDGIEFCRKIKTNENTSHIPLILLTAKVTTEDALEGLNTGADAYITKPFDTKILRSTVKNLLESRKQLRDKYSKSVTLEPAGITITSVDEKFIKKAIAIVEKHISDPDYSVDMFSKEIGMSRSHLHRKFNGLAGVSPSGFIRTLRMKRAAQLLIKGQLTVSEILYEIGIKSRSYFIKSFKEQFGMSPTDFAEKNYQTNSISE